MKKENLVREDKDVISVIIPAYKAEKFIKKSLIQVKEVLDQINTSYEIICVIDGDVDNSFQIAKKVAHLYPKIEVFGYKENHGKGHAVRFGMAKSKGNIVAFIDAGVDINPNGLSLLMEHLKWYNADIIVGSKRHPASKVHYPFSRKIVSFVYQMLVKILFGLKIRDTQFGLKIFRREVLEKTLPRLLVKAFAFDIEMLSVANYLGFKRIYEAPIETRMTFKGSTIIAKGFVKQVFLIVWDTIAVFYRLKIRHYYDDKNRNNWVLPTFLTQDSKK